MDTETLDAPNADANGIAEMDAQIAADEAQWAKEGRGTVSEQPGGQPAGRDEQGRFTSATEAQRAGQPKATRDDESEGSPGDNEPIVEQPPASKAGEQATPKPQSTSPRPSPQSGEGEEVKGRQESAWAKENNRKLKTWTEINADKQALATEREQLRLEREQVQAQSAQAATTVRDAGGYAATDYEQAAKKFEQAAQKFKVQSAALAAQALTAEQAGDYERVDRLNDQAERLNQHARQEATLAAEAARHAEGLRPLSPGIVWQRLAEDLPEVLTAGGPLTAAEVRKMMRATPALLGDPMGPYRATVQMGRKVLQATEGKLAKAEADAGKLPGLQKQVEELTSKVRELTKLTSLPGGGAAISRGGSEGRKFEDFSLREMEAALASGEAAAGSY